MVRFTDSLKEAIRRAANLDAEQSNPDAYYAAAIKRLSAEEVWPLERRTVGSNEVLSHPDDQPFRPDRILHKAAAINITRLLQHRPDRRNELVQNTRRVFCNNKDAVIIKADIKACYESISLKEVASRCRADWRLEPSVRRIIDRYARSTDYARMGNDPSRGLPRGLALSAALSEYFLQAVDREMRDIPGLIFYGRFVDDMIFVCLPRNEGQTTDCVAEEMKSKIEAILNTNNLSLNSDGGKFGAIASEHSGGGSGIDFLGYRFCVSSKTSAMDIHLDLSDRSFHRYQARILGAIRRLRNGQDKQLFFDTIKLLTGNYIIGKTPGTLRLRKAGIYYRYPLITRRTLDDSKTVPGRLEQLDSLLYRMIYGKGGSDTQSAREFLTRSERRQLYLMRFSDGFDNRRVVEIGSENRQRVIRVMKGDSR